MLPAPFKVVLDANVLYPFSLRDTLLRAASEGLFQLYWSDQILERGATQLGQLRKKARRAGHAPPLGHGRGVPGGDGDGPRAAHRRNEERREGSPRRRRRSEGRSSGRRDQQPEALSRTAGGHRSAVSG